MYLRTMQALDAQVRGFQPSPPVEKLGRKGFHWPPRRPRPAILLRGVGEKLAMRLPGSARAGRGDAQRQAADYVVADGVALPARLGGADDVC